MERAWICLTLSQQWTFCSMIHYEDWQFPCTEAQWWNTKKHSDTESVDIAELAMSDLEDESDAIFERFS